MKTHQKCQKMTIQPETDFSQTYAFREMLDNIELITDTKFQKILMTECKDMGKKLQKKTKMGFSPFATPKIFFKNCDLLLLYPHGALSSCQKNQKKLMNSL